MTLAIMFIHTWKRQDNTKQKTPPLSLSLCVVISSVLGPSLHHHHHLHLHYLSVYHTTASTGVGLVSLEFVRVCCHPICYSGRQGAAFRTCTHKKYGEYTNASAGVGQVYHGRLKQQCYFVNSCLVLVYRQDTPAQTSTHTHTHERFLNKETWV